VDLSDSGPPRRSWSRVHLWSFARRCHWD
jgi:hypothetical protein